MTFNCFEMFKFHWLSLTFVHLMGQMYKRAHSSFTKTTKFTFTMEHTKVRVNTFSNPPIHINCVHKRSLNEMKIIFKPF